MTTPNQDLIQTARKRYDELDRTIKAADAVRDEWQRLQSFLVMVHEMEERLFQHVEQTPSNPQPTAQNGNGHYAPPSKMAPTIPDRAEAVIRQRGALHLKDLFREMRAAGWKATGDDRNDIRNLQNSINGRKERFKNLGNNVWDVVAKRPTNDSGGLFANQ